MVVKKLAYDQSWPSRFRMLIVTQYRPELSEQLRHASKDREKIEKRNILEQNVCHLVLMSTNST